MVGRGWKRTKPRILEDEASVDALDLELAEVGRHIEDHKAENLRREREARAQGPCFHKYLLEKGLMPTLQIGALRQFLDDERGRCSSLLCLPVCLVGHRCGIGVRRVLHLVVLVVGCLGMETCVGLHVGDAWW